MITTATPTAINPKIINLIMPTHSPYTHNKHRIMKDFLEQGFDYLISIDDDNPPLNNPIDLVFYGLDIIGCPTPVWANMKKGDQPFYYNVMTRKIVDGIDGYTPYNYKEGEQLVECDAVGSGCSVIARRVLEKLKDDMPFNIEWDQYGFPARGTDFAFCKRAKDAGFKVYAHYDYPCLHFHEVELSEIINAMMNMKLNGG
jgi:hypothetical protein